jgi:O-methyltransferase
MDGSCGAAIATIVAPISATKVSERRTVMRLPSDQLRGVAATASYGVTDRLVWVADSFQGLPPPDAELYPADAGDTHHTFAELAVSLDEVKANFERFGMLDDNVRFLKGWFHETLADPRIKQLSVLRLDGDMYGSTMNALVHLYPRLSVGGYIIVDDYGAVPGCRKAVDDFRATRRIAEEMREIDWAGVFWQRRV